MVTLSLKNLEAKFRNHVIILIHLIHCPSSLEPKTESQTRIEGYQNCRRSGRLSFCHDHELNCLLSTMVLIRLIAGFNYNSTNVNLKKLFWSYNFPFGCMAFIVKSIPGYMALSLTTMHLCAPS